MYEPFDETAARVLLAIDSGDSIRRVAQHLHTPYETVRQAVNRLEDAGYLAYDDSIEEAYVLPQFGDWPFAFARTDAAYIWTQGGYQVGRDPDDYPLFSPSVSRTSRRGRAFSSDSGCRPRSSGKRATRSMDHYRLSSMDVRRSGQTSSKGIL